MISRITIYDLKRLQVEENFHRLPATLEAYREQLGHAGHGGRGKDVFGTLLACADIAIGDAWEESKVPMGEDLRAWRKLLDIKTMEEYEDTNENWQGCLNHLLSVQVEVWRYGKKPTVGKYLIDYWEHRESSKFEDVRSELALAGLGFIQKKGGGHRDDTWLAVPNNSPLIHALFLGSDWAGDLGAGVWRGALRQGGKGELWESRTARINGVSMRCTMISLKALYGDDGIYKENG